MYKMKLCAKIFGISKMLASFKSRYLIALIFVFSSCALLIITLFAKKYTSYPKNFDQIRIIDEAPQNFKNIPEDRGGKKFQNGDRNVFTILE